MTAEPRLTPDSRDQAPPSPDRLRRVLGAFATGVTVITALDGNRPVGFACQSFASVSLEPPLVLFCADRQGRTWPRIREARRFCVNVLSHDQEDLVRRFGASRGAKFDGLGWDLSRWGAPMLRGALTRVHGEVSDVHPTGDHDVVIGRVLDVDAPGDQEPMIYFRSGFGVGGREDGSVAEADLWAWGDRWE